MRAGLDKRWLLPFGILAISALIALGILILKPTFVDRSSAEVAQQATNNEAATDCSDAPATDPACDQEHYQEAASGPTRTEEIAAADCSGASATDYICYQQRYQNLVRDRGVEAA